MAAERPQHAAAAVDSCVPGVDPRPVAAAAPTGMILALPRSRQISIEARAAVRGFAGQLGAKRTADACLLVSELVTNAYRHGQGQIRLTITLGEHVARFAIHARVTRHCFRPPTLTSAAAGA